MNSDPRNIRRDWRDFSMLQSYRGIKEKFVIDHINVPPAVPYRKAWANITDLLLYEGRTVPPSCQQHENEWKKRASGAHSVYDKQ